MSEHKAVIEWLEDWAARAEDNVGTNRFVREMIQVLDDNESMCDRTMGDMHFRCTCYQMPKMPCSLEFTKEMEIGWITGGLEPMDFITKEVSRLRANNRIWSETLRHKNQLIREDGTIDNQLNNSKVEEKYVSFE